MWAIGAGILNQSKSQGKGKDMWGWSCVDNKRRHLFENDVSYALVCRLQVSITANLPFSYYANNRAELVPCLLHHRSRRRDTLYHHLRHRLLPILVQEEAEEVHGCPRQGPL